MYTFFLTMESPVASDWPVQILKNLGRVYQDDGFLIVIAPAGMQEGWIAISEVEPIMESQEHAALVHSVIKDPVRFMVEGRDTKTNFANQLLLALDDSTKTVIENDQGCVACAISFKALAKAGISWLTISNVEELDADKVDNPANTRSIPSVL